MSRLSSTFTQQEVGDHEQEDADLENGWLGVSHYLILYDFKYTN